MKRVDLIAYAHAYVSFVLPRLKIPFKDIILFGSVARGDFGPPSDLDLFFNVIVEKDAKKLEEELKPINNLFYKSKIYELWKQKGIINIINAKTGVLDQWELKSSILADGIMLQGKYKNEIKGEGHILISFSPIRNITKRNRIMRTIFGREEKVFKKEGLVIKRGGVKISPTVFIIPLQFSSEVLSLLRKEKVDFQLREIWSLQKL